MEKVEGNGSSVAPWVTGNHPNAPSLLAHRITAITLGFEPSDWGSIPCGPVKYGARPIRATNF